MRAIVLLFFLLPLLSLEVAVADGGPPMITDDPNTVGSNKWEINVAQLTLASPSQTVVQRPYVDVNYGLGDNLQLKYETGVNGVISSAIPYGGPYATAGVRWKFFDDETSGLELSTYPQYSFYPGYYGTTATVDPSITSFFLPIELSQKFGEYTFNPELGYGFVSNADNYWSLGLLLSREMGKSWSLMAELHLISPVGFGLSQYVFNIGTAIDVCENLGILASAGTSFATTSAFTISYLGLQIRF